MKSYELSHLSDPVLLRDLAAAVARSSTATADVLAHIAEVDARKLYLPAAYPSMYAYCVGELRLSEDAAFKRIKAARAARRFPEIFKAVAEGRLHLSAVVLLAPHLTEDTADELLAAATHRSKSDIEQLLAERFPQPDMLAWVAAIPTPTDTRSAEQQAPGPVEDRLAPGRVGADLQQAPGPVGDRPRVKPLAPQRFAVQFTMSQVGRDKLRYAQELLGHRVHSGDIAAVFEQALDALVERLEKRKFAATSRPNCGTRRGTASPRHIPADVKRAVLERDGYQCTFESETGRRCEARSRLEYDHVLEVARGGESTLSGVQLRCRAHNQYGAECTFGAEFMRHKRIAATEARAIAQAQSSAARAAVTAIAQAPIMPGDRDVVPWLRKLGFSASEARLGAAGCDHIPGASLEQRVRVALSCIGVRGTRMGRAG
jgi:5-methylcytosine-specific restriction endonuclease McrA